MILHTFGVQVWHRGSGLKPPEFGISGWVWVVGSGVQGLGVRDPGLGFKLRIEG